VRCAPWRKRAPPLPFILVEGIFSPLGTITLHSDGVCPSMIPSYSPAVLLLVLDSDGYFLRTPSPKPLGRRQFFLFRFRRLLHDGESPDPPGAKRLRVSLASILSGSPFPSQPPSFSRRSGSLIGIPCFWSRGSGDVACSGGLREDSVDNSFHFFPYHQITVCLLSLGAGST